MAANTSRGMLKFIGNSLLVASSFYGVCSFISNYYWLGNVNGGSMKPTFNTEWGHAGAKITKDWILIKRVKYHKFELEKDQIVVFLSPQEPTTTAVKRIKALPGETYTSRDNVTTFIPKGHVWVEGDNSASSVDSNMYGPIPMALIQGKVVCVVYPKFKWI
ncbi:hypothetical protein ABK040_014045 [Willaertia magna]